MAWRRGFFRLWVLFAVVWVLGTVAVGVEGIAEPYVSQKAFVFRTSQPGRPSLIDDVEAYEFREGANRGELKVYEFEDIPDIMYSLASTAEDVEAERAKAVHTLATKLRSEAKVTARAKAIRETALFAVLPPIVLLVIGTAIGWVLSGFRAQPVQNSE